MKNVHTGRGQEGHDRVTMEMRESIDPRPRIQIADRRGEKKDKGKDRR